MRTTTLLASILGVAALAVALPTTKQAGIQIAARDREAAVGPQPDGTRVTKRSKDQTVEPDGTRVTKRSKDQTVEPDGTRVTKRSKDQTVEPDGTRVTKRSKDQTVEPDGTRVTRGE